MSQINSQLLQQFRREIQLLKDHKDGKHVDKVLKCDVCFGRPSSLKARVEKFKKGGVK